MEKKWHKEYDVIVVGSGAAGLTAALTAKLQGLSVLVIEKTDKFGGSTALSGGAIWVPNNLYLQEAGLEDTLENAQLYLKSTVGDSSPQELQNTYLTEGVKMVRYLAENTEVKWSYVKGYSDYYPTKEGGKPEGRSIEPQLFNAKRLGQDLKAMRRSQIPSMGMVLMAKEFHKVNMMTRIFAGLWQGVKLGFRFMAQTLSLGRYKPVSLGEALIARLMYSYRQAGGEIWLSAPFTKLIKDEEGKVIGVEIKKDFNTIALKANKGTIFGTGGFSHNQQLREKYLPKPSSTSWSLASEGQTGDLIPEALEAGAALGVMDRVWGTPTALIPGQYPHMPVAERAVPGMIIVDQIGKRYMNEVTPYHEFVDRMYAHDPKKSIPSWYIFDQRAKNRYLLFGVIPFLPFSKKWIKEGFIKKAKTIDELATQINISTFNLNETLGNFNNYVQNNKDLEFNRGETAHDTFYGDPTLKNPNLALINKPPYYAVALYPGDIGTKGGVKINENGQALREDGSVIEGLYVAGNASAAVMGYTYPGPGATIGPAMVFGYIAAKHIANK